MKKKKKEIKTWHEKYGKTKKRMKYMKLYMRAYRKSLSTAKTCKS